MTLFGVFQPSHDCLLIQHLVKPQIVGVHVDGGVGGLLDAVQADHVIDVRVGDDDGADFQMMALENFENFFGVVSGIDDDGVVRFRVSDDVAIALQHADGKNFVNRGWRGPA